jgi:AraC-like DNA-binding protein
VWAGLFPALAGAHTFAFGALVLRAQRGYQRGLRDRVSTIGPRASLLWTRHVTWASSLLSLVALGYAATSAVPGRDAARGIHVCVAAVAAYAALGAITDRRLGARIASAAGESELPAAPSDPAPWTLDGMRDRLDATRAYADPALDVVSFARLAGASPAALTALFHGGRVTFYDFVNVARVDAAKRRLAATSEPTGAIARAVGFASEAALRVAFQRIERRSPIAYRDAVRDADAPDARHSLSPMA